MNSKREVNKIQEFSGETGSMLDSYLFYLGKNLFHSTATVVNKSPIVKVHVVIGSVGVVKIHR